MRRKDRVFDYGSEHGRIVGYGLTLHARVTLRWSDEQKRHKCRA